MPLAGITNNTSQFSAPGGAGTGSASLDAMFDGRYFAAGLGVGFGTYPYFQNSFSRESIAFALTQLVRIGALDGLNFGAQTQLVATPVGFNLYGGEAMLQVPIRRKWLLQFRGGGLAAPFAFGDIGMRIGLGDAEKSRLFLTPTVGVAYVGGLAGPSVGLGFEYRP